MAVTLREAFAAFWEVLSENQRRELIGVTRADSRECGYMGCHHPRCAERCAAVPASECWGCGHGHRATDRLCDECRGVA